VTCFLRVRQLRNTKQAALFAGTIKRFISGTETHKHSVFREQCLTSSSTGQCVLRSVSTSEVSIGDRHRKCEDVECVIIRDSSDC
jgi:hypothetical protein